MDGVRVLSVCLTYFAPVSPFPSLQSQRFVEQYYKKLSETPDQLFGYYVEESTFSHTEDPNAESVAVSGLENIKQQICKLNLPSGLGKCHVDIASGSVDAQSAAPDGSQIMIVVIGRLALNARSYPFSQSFLLVRCWH